MLYSLNYVSHPIERVNQVVFFFLKNSIQNHVYSKNLFPDWFRDVLANSKSKSGELSFDDKFEEVFTELQKLSLQRRTSLFNEFRDGLDIRSLCEERNKPVVLTENYSADLHSSINKLLKDHFYKTSLGSNKTLETNLDTTLANHYVQFKSANNSGRVCPFCGLHEYSILEGESKDDYDHWLYKSKYPLYAINFANLVPMCGKCNQTGVKGTADVLHDPVTGHRRQSFYPYDKTSGIKIEVDNYLRTDQLDEVQKEKYPYGYFSLSIDPQLGSEAEKVTTWKEVFKIETRYNSFLSSFYNILIEEFHEDYLPGRPGILIDRNPNTLVSIVSGFKNQLGSLKRRTGVEVYRSYLDYICKPENRYMLYTFFRINLAA